MARFDVTLERHGLEIKGKRNFSLGTAISINTMFSNP